MFRKNIQIALLIILNSYTVLSGQVLFNQPAESFSDIVNSELEGKYSGRKLLHNGIYYENIYFNAKGHPFLFEDHTADNSVLYRSNLYEHLDLKYDLFIQKIIVYEPSTIGTIPIILPTEFVSSFVLNGYHFQKMIIDNEERYYQVVADHDHIKAYAYWFKLRKKSENMEGILTYQLTQCKIKNMLEIDGQLKYFRNNRSFVRLFPDMYRSELKSYLKTRHIRVENAKDRRLKELYSMCNQFLSETK